MALSEYTPFRDCCPQLHQLLVEVDELATEASRKERLLRYVAEFPELVRQADGDEQDRRKRRKNYFVNEVFAPGAKVLRDGTKPVEGMLWAWYYDRTLEDVEHLRHEVYYATHVSPYRPPAPQRQIKRRVKCYSRYGDGYVTLDFHAWAPPDLAHDTANENQQPQAPLPPTKRRYCLPEIAWGLVALHDADGGLEPLIPEGDPLDNHRWWLEVGGLGSSLRDRSNFERWVPRLRLMWGRLRSAILNELGEPVVASGIVTENAPNDSPSIPETAIATSYGNSPLLRLVRVLTDGVADDRIIRAAHVLENERLTANEKLTKINALIAIPPVSAEKLGDLIGVSKQAIHKTGWWVNERRGEKDSEIGRRGERYRERAKEMESYPHENDEW